MKNIVILINTGKIGWGHYKEEHGKWVPEENIGEYLRGGVVSTMAVFEAFMSSIIDRSIQCHHI